MWILEKNISTGEPEYVFSGMENGIGDSPYTGIASMIGFNIKNYPKVAYSNIARALSTQSTPPATQVNYIIQDPNNLTNLYSVTDLGVVRQSVNSGKTWTLTTAAPTAGDQGRGNGIFIYGGFLHVIRDLNIDAIAINASGVTGAWTTMQNNAATAPIFSTTTQAVGQNHFSLVGRDGISGTVTVNNTYICNGKYIASLIPKPNATYNPADQTTYTWNETALGLPTNSYGFATHLCELRTSLLITTGNLIVPWDRTSTSYDIPFPFTETVSKMVNINNIIYCFGGVPTANAASSYIPNIAGRGNIYYFNGFVGGIIKKIPDSLAAPFVDDPEWIIGGVMVQLNRIYFGAINNNGGITVTGGGVYSLDVGSEGQAIQYQISPAPLNVENGNQEFLYTALCSSSDILVNSTILSYAGAYIDNINSVFRFNYTDQAGNRESAVLQTDILQVGTRLQNKTFNRIEIRFRNPLSIGETVDVFARKYFRGSTATNSSYTYTAGAGSTELSFTFPTIVQQNEEIQLMIITTPINNGSGVPIKEIRLI